MNKTQYIVLAISFVVTIGIFFLPKAVVSNEDSQVVDGENSTETQNKHASGVISDTTRAKLESLFTQLSSVSLQSDSLGTIAKIVEALQLDNSYDSAAYFAENLANKNTSVLLYQLVAANAYYDAFTLAVKPERISYFATGAKEFIERSLAMDSTQLDLRVKLGMTYVNSESPMQGILMIRDVLKKDPNNQLALLNLGVLSMQSGQYDKALERFETLRKLPDSDKVQVTFYLAICHKELRNKEAAVEAFQFVLNATNSPEVQRTVQSYLDELL